MNVTCEGEGEGEGERRVGLVRGEGEGEGGGDSRGTQPVRRPTTSLASGAGVRLARLFANERASGLLPKVQRVVL